MNSKGEVKISRQERCRAVDRKETGHKDVKALGEIMTRLMKRSSTGMRSVGNSNLYPWSTEAKEFLSATSFASAKDLIDVSLQILLFRTSLLTSEVSIS